MFELFFLYCADKKSKVRDIHTLKPTGISHFLALQSECESHIDHQELLHFLLLF